MSVQNYYFFIFILFLVEIPVSKQCRPDQTPRSAVSVQCLLESAASNLGLHCLPMSQIWDARQIWINLILRSYTRTNTI